MSDPNPYLTPETITAPPLATAAQSTDLVRRVGKTLIVWDGAVLPSRCVRTNVPTGPDDVTLTKKLTYTPSWAMLGGGVLLAALLQKKFTVTYSLSAAEAAKLKKRTRYGWLTFCLGLAVFIGGFALMANGRELEKAGILMMPVGIIMLLGGLIVATSSTVLRPIGHKKGWFTLKGPSKDFIDSIGSP